MKDAWDENTPTDAKPFIIYSASKAEGERAAWNWVIENKPSFTLNTVLPNLVVGEKQHLPYMNLAESPAFARLY